MSDVSRSADHTDRERPEAFDASDTPSARELDVGYLDGVLPTHVKAKLKKTDAERRRPESVSRQALAGVTNPPKPPRARLVVEGLGERNVDTAKSVDMKVVV